MTTDHSIPTERPAAPGELCTCGRQAITVYLTGLHGQVGYCGLADGGARATPCPFCGEHTTHLTAWGDPARCPAYRLRPGGTPPACSDCGAAAGADCAPYCPATLGAEDSR